MRIAVLLAFCFLVACTAERTVLDNPEGVVVACAQAFSAEAGAACALASSCQRPSPRDPDCCSDTATCTGGLLARDTSCRPECGCTDDRDCVVGQALCADQRCQPCPSVSTCAPCPTGWVRLERHGCEVCQCGPPPECDQPGAACAGGEVCYLGKNCSVPCDPLEPSCCSRTCSAPGCNDPSPAGCFMACPAASPCQLCAASACECTGGSWSCTPECADSALFVCRFP